MLAARVNAQGVFLVLLVGETDEVVGLGALLALGSFAADMFARLVVAAILLAYQVVEAPAVPLQADMLI